MKFSAVIAFSFCLSSFFGIAFADTVVASSSKDQSSVFRHYADKSRGWHWKEPIPEPDPVPEPEIAPPAPPPPPSPAAKVEPPKPEGPKPLSADWIRQNIPKYLDAAIDDPSPQNVSNYLYLQRYAMDSADRFSQVFKRVALSDPNLDANNSRPVWSGASIAMDKAADEGKKKVLSDISKIAGIWFFYRSDCAPCHQQAPVLALFARLHGFSVFPIALDGLPMPNSPFKSYAVDRGQAAHFGVTGTPSIFLAQPPDKMYPIGEGLMALGDLQERVVEISMQAGLINDKQYKTTRGDKKEFLPPSSSPVMAKLDPQTASDPNSVKNYLRQLISNRNPKLGDKK